MPSNIIHDIAFHVVDSHVVYGGGIDHVCITPHRSSVRTVQGLAIRVPEIFALLEELVETIVSCPHDQTLSNQ